MLGDRSRGKYYKRMNFYPENAKVLGSNPCTFDSQKRRKNVFVFTFYYCDKIPEVIRKKMHVFRDFRR